MMNKIIYIGFIYAFMGVANAAEIPAPLRGVWTNGGFSSCEVSSEIGEFPFLLIRKNEIFGHERICTVDDVKEISKFTWRLKFTCSMEGEQTKETHIYKLKYVSNDVLGKKLIEKRIVDNRFEWRMCPYVSE